MTYLSPELISEILTRLPPDSILRFRCVSKRFRSEIDDPRFIKLQIRHGPRQALTFGGEGVRLIENIPAFPKKPECGKQLVGPMSGCGFRGSCHGLIALPVSQGDGVVIWNPYTRKHWTPPIADVVYPGDENWHFSALGFGYDSVSDDYKVVRIVQFGWTCKAQVTHEVKVYSFKSNSWRQISDLPSGLEISCRRPYGVFAFDALHFVYTRSVPLYGLRFCILAFSLHMEKLRNLVELPIYVTASRHRFVDVTVLGGQLCVVLNSRGGEMEAWVMKDYGSREESWNKLFLVNLHSPDFADPPYLLDYSEGGNKALVHYGRSGFAWIDLDSRNHDDVRLKRSWDMQDVTLLVGSLASLGVEVGHNETVPKAKVVQTRRVFHLHWALLQR